MDRRHFIAGAAATSALAPASLSAQSPARPFAAPYAPVASTPGRVIRSVVGLRPFRRIGFRLEAERFGRRTVVHNYGHGGCGRHAVSRLR